MQGKFINKYFFFNASIPISCLGCEGASQSFQMHNNKEMQLFLEENPDLCTFLGGDEAPLVRVIAFADSTKLGGVRYEVYAGSVNIKLTEDIINLFRNLHEPKADELNKLRAEYLADREEDPTLPEWRDYFEYGPDLRRIYKYTPPIGDAPAEKPSSEASDEALDAGVEVISEVEDASLENLVW